MKKENVFKAAIIIVAVAITGGVVGFKFAQRTQAPTKPIAQNKNVTTGLEIQSNVRVAKAGYKIVEVKNPEVSFSFEVPEKWMTETRNSGEKQLSVEEKKAFLGTTYSDSGESYPAYYDFGVIENIEKMSEKEINDIFNEKMYGDQRFSTASVSSTNYIWYSDWNAFQVDFSVRKGAAFDIVNEIKKESAEICKENGEDFVGCGNNASKWSKSKIDDENVDIETYALDSDEKGNEISTKGGTGGKAYYIEIPNLNKTLVISKQAKGDAQFEKDFDNLIQTLKIK
jgi:hypothetical protein